MMISIKPENIHISSGKIRFKNVIVDVNNININYNTSKSDESVFYIYGGYPVVDNNIKNISFNTYNFNEIFNLREALWFFESTDGYKISDISILTINKLTRYTPAYYNIKGLILGREKAVNSSQMTLF